MAQMIDGNGAETGSISTRHSPVTELVPAPAANFKGSFAPAGRKSAQPLHWKHGRRYVVYEYFTRGWDHLPIWKSAFIEMMATMSLCYLSALIGLTLVNMHTSQLPAYVGITNIFLLSLFIYASAPASGGHVNPTITFATMTTGLIEFPRAILYLCAQTIGGGVAGGLIRGSFGVAMTDKYGSCVLCLGKIFWQTLKIRWGRLCPEHRCSFSWASISDRSDLIFHHAVCWVHILPHHLLLTLPSYLAFGVGLDPRQAEMFGPRLGPLFVGCTLGLVSFASSGLVSGYTGAAMNPARCFAFATARANYKGLFILEFFQTKRC